MEGWIGRGGRRCPKEAEASGGFGGKGGVWADGPSGRGGGLAGGRKAIPSFPPSLGD